MYFLCPMLEVQGVSKEKVYGCKIIPKLMRAQNLQNFQLAQVVEHPLVEMCC